MLDGLVSTNCTGRGKEKKHYYGGSRASSSGQAEDDSGSILKEDPDSLQSKTNQCDNEIVSHS
jgi:hypothetical protein